MTKKPRLRIALAHKKATEAENVQELIRPAILSALHDATKKTGELSDFDITRPKNNRAWLTKHLGKTIPEFKAMAVTTAQKHLQNALDYLFLEDLITEEGQNTSKPLEKREISITNDGRAKLIELTVKQIAQADAPVTKTQKPTDYS